MTMDSASTTWHDALSESMIHARATKAEKTVVYYRTQLTGLIKWSEREDVGFREFGKRDLERYLVFRREAGKSPSTLHSDAVCAKAFCRWCSRSGLLPRSPLAEYQVRAAPKPPRYMPSEDNVRTLLGRIAEYWDPQRHEAVRYFAAPKRIFRRERMTCLYMVLLDTSCRIGEALSFKVDDWEPDSRRLMVRESKGRELRTLPVSQPAAQALNEWLKQRRKIIRNVPPAEDEGWLLVSETGGQIIYQVYGRTHRTYLS